MVKKVCMFCMRSHKKKPALCQAKGDVLRAFLDKGVQFWQLMAGVESGTLPLEGEALRLVAARKKHPKTKYKVQE